MNQNIKAFVEKTRTLLAYLTLDFKRYLYHEIRWNNRLIGIKGARGTGKTTLILQWLKAQNFAEGEAVYLSLDDLYFTNHNLRDFADEFYKNGGKVLVLDEVHKYKNWSIEIKNIYDYYPSLKLIFTGSSIIDIAKEQADLSRRALMYDLQGLSFREYLAIKNILKIDVVDLETLVKNHADIYKKFPSEFRPIKYFNAYLANGYYPFLLEDDQAVAHRVQQLIRAIVEYDMAELPGFDIRNASKLLQLLYIISQQVPFKPNISALSEKTQINRTTLTNYLYYLEEARLTRFLYTAGNSLNILQKPAKLFLNNTTLQYALSGDLVERGMVRETFFLSQVAPVCQVFLPKQGDFIVNHKYTFELGGKNKTAKQIQNIEHAFVVQDDIEIGFKSILPLYMFGFLY